MKDRQSGFTIVELGVGLGISAAAMLLLATMMASGLRGLLQGKQRSSANTESNAVLEQARNLPYDDLGLVSTDTTLGTDPALVVQSGQKFYRTDDPCVPGATHLEPLQYATNTTAHVYNPHQATYTVGSTSMTRYVYVTGVDETCPAPDGTIDYKRVTVRTVFNNPAHPADAVRNEVRAQTVISPETPGAPGAPPQNAGLAPLSGIASARGGEATVLIKTGTNACIDAGCDPDTVAMTLSRTQGITTILGASSVSCTGETPHLSARTVATGTSEIVSHSQSRSADDDSATASPNAGPNSSTQSYTDLPPAGSALDQYLLEPSVASTTTCASSAVGLPTESGTSEASGSITYEADVTGTGLDVSSVELVTVSGDRSDNTITHSGAATGDREISFSATRTLSGMRALKTTAVGLVAVRGLVNVLSTSVTATAAVHASSPSSPPSLNVGAGVDVEVYDPAFQLSDCVARPPGDAYCKIHIDANQAGFTGRSFVVSVNTGADASKYAYSLETKVQLNPRKLANGTSTPGGTLYEAQYSPMTATTRLILRVPGILPGTYVAQFDGLVHLDLGQVLSRGCYGTSSGVSGCL